MCVQVFIAFMVFGCLALLGGIMALFMPETLGAAMPETSEVRWTQEWGALAE